MEQPQPLQSSSPTRDRVQVAVRLRPLLKRELCLSGDTQSTFWSLSPTSITQYINGKPVPFHSFSFDHVFLQNTTNETVFDTVARPVVASAIDGINGVIFAYGQTAAGKTHTMLGNKADPGITLRSISDLFERVSKLPSRKFLLRASYIEIYNEFIRDLLVPSNDNLKIHEDIVKNMVYVNSHRKVVTSVDDVMKIISAGEAVRAIGATNMNEKASRSHTIFTITIESREILRSTAESVQRSGVAVRNSTLALVDLAGSERASLTKAHGKRLTEGGFINKSLLTLGTVIKKLSSEPGQGVVHIPYRDSKLTRLLQPALGGNARTVIICAATTATVHMEETLSTLKFASRAKRVTNHAEANEFLDDRAKLRRAERQIASLKKEMKTLRTLIVNNSTATDKDEEHSKGVEQSWKRKVEESVSGLISLVQSMSDDCPKCLLSRNADEMREKEKRIKDVKALMENCPQSLRAECEGKDLEAVETLRSSVKRLQDSLMLKELELTELERKSVNSSKEEKINRLEYAESENGRSMSICTSDDSLTESSLDSSSSSDGNDVMSRAELVKNLQHSFEEKKFELDALFRQLSLLKSENESDGGASDAFDAGVTLGISGLVAVDQKGCTKGEGMCEAAHLRAFQTPLLGEEEWKTGSDRRDEAGKREVNCDEGDEVEVSQLASGGGGLYRLSSVVRRVLIASCAIWFHCSVSRFFNFRTHRGLDVSIANVTDCASV
eukprot:TRINITY_DN48072_c0_g1_i1.p1 TRINITY_DN48072_c0_g1~~TRINITY_DN48072_c0_g1_i1.p1  ORF type:complete len:726 (+),score=89.20 TRINITY_DN48072_c0_g1_i1:85-2262(+)